MKIHAARALLILLACATSSAAQGLSAKWEELTGPDFVAALDASKGTCTLPFGIIEKHGPAGNHYQGDSGGATAARGDAVTRTAAVSIANAIRAIKADVSGPRLQKEFFEKAAKPTITKQ